MHLQLPLKENLKREIILLSDFRKQDWQNWDGTAAEAFRERLSSTPNNPELTWIDFGSDAPKNLSRESVDFSKTIGIGHPVRIRATIRNFSEEKFDGNLKVKLFADQNETAIDEAVILLALRHNSGRLYSSV